MYIYVNLIAMTIIVITVTNKCLNSLDTIKINDNHDKQGQTKSTDSPSNLSTREIDLPCIN